MRLNDIKLFCYNHKKVFIALLSVIIMTITITLILFKDNKLKTESIVYESTARENLEANEISNLEEKEFYYVDIKGEVTNPGVYSLEKGKRIVDAINQAGGLLEDANTSLLNLSMEIEDGMVIIVYSNLEVNNYDTIKEETKAKEAICTKEVYNDACICNSESQKVPSEEVKDKEEANETDEIVTSQKINLNKASLEELITLPKIGSSKAQAIIDYRNQNGDFQSIEDIKNVRGIGESIFATIKPYITV